jgi:8-oxo-dGTP pyrophosphatase MutT (NUDIX family)
MSDALKVLKTREIYDGKIFKVRVDTVELDGKTRDVELVVHPGSFAIAALPDDDHIVLVRQYRHPAGLSLWEIPAGTAEPGEPPDSGARRELREETGCLADSWQLLCSLYPTPGFCTESVRIYAARELHPGPPEPEEDERIEVRHVSFQDAWRMQASGEIIDMKTMVALLWLSKRPFK